MTESSCSMASTHAKVFRWLAPPTTIPCTTITRHPFPELFRFLLLETASRQTCAKGKLQREPHTDLFSLLLTACLAPISLSSASLLPWMFHIPVGDWKISPHHFPLQSHRNKLTRSTLSIFTYGLCFSCIDLHFHVMLKDSVGVVDHWTLLPN